MIAATAMYNLVTVLTVDCATYTYDVCAKLTEANEYLTDTKDSERQVARLTLMTLLK